ncbi:disulfide bond formation protein B [Marinimicrobium sp. ABcell2]|uniref:disulfide bond formation protein B n=1 Tax=Marinimicrobium sp. ABcell2 TaxID=3069751 RepID=UPI0027B4603B|nr:disulfide bond formation protein B [Marinimicrobium sp. ABcell2]MDQ2076123.1 disulfide bond formation protein B [Marinimicrobium sp. ABcell2]
MLPSVRQTNFLIVFACSLLLAIALYMEHVMGLVPCPLCMTQRVFVALVGLLALVAFVHHPRRLGRRVYASLGLLAAVIGGGFSTRQLWLQSLPPDRVPACGPDLYYMLDVFPFLDTLRVMITGDGNCAEVSWTFLGVSIPGWTLLAFVALAALNVWQFVRR